jgi:hypothetical protein
MLRHQHVADDSEAQLRAQIAERLDELTFKAVKDAGAPIDVRGEVVKVVA